MSTKKLSDPNQESAVLGYVGLLGFSGIEASAICVPDDFTDERWRPIYAAAYSLHRLGWGVNHFSIVEEIARLRLDEELARHFPLGWSDWMDSVDKSLQFGGPGGVTQCLRTIRALSLTRKTMGIGQALTEGALDAEEAADRLRAIREESEGEGLDAILDARRFDATRPPPPNRVIYSLRGKAICTPGNLASVCAKIKAGKTGGVGALMGSALGLPGDTLSFESANPEGRALVHFDTEQSPSDHHEHVQGALRRVNLSDCPAWLRSYRVTDVPGNRRFDLLERELARAARAHGGIHSVILDGIADYIADPNDAADAFAAVERLHRLAIQYDTAIIGVLHINPGSEINKTRGHLGSQLERKAETNLVIEKDDNEISTIYSTASRHFFLPKLDGPRFRWNAEKMLHLSCGSEREERDCKIHEKLRLFAGEAFGANSLRYTAACDAIKKVAKVKDARAQGLFTEMKEAGILSRDEVGFWKVVG